MNTERQPPIPNPHSTNPHSAFHIPHSAFKGSAIKGFIQAGGRSSRMKQDKAWLEVDGAPMIERVVAAAGPAAGRLGIIVNAANPQIERYERLAESCDAGLIFDLHEHLGPLGGVHTALAHCGAGESALILACDLPFITTDLLRFLCGVHQGENPQSASPQFGRNPQSPLMFTGIHVLDPGIFEYIPRGVFSDSVRDVYPKAMADGKNVAAHVADGASSWRELSTIERYLTISLEFLRREGRDTIMDEGCEVESGATVERSVLWRRARVCGGARLTECVVGDDVIIPSDAEFRRAAIVRVNVASLNDRPEKALPAEIVGDNLVVKFG
jgi:molybdopterin-guanine dinucleotide biosynthesis protein A